MEARLFSDMRLSMEWLPGKKTKYYEACSLRETGLRINPHNYFGLNGRHDKQRFLPDLAQTCLNPPSRQSRLDGHCSIFNVHEKQKRQNSSPPWVLNCFVVSKKHDKPLRHIVKRCSAPVFRVESRRSKVEVGSNQPPQR